MLKRQQMIERLVGVESSKINYYTQLKKTVDEMEKKNIQLEIINEVMKSFNVNMSKDSLLKIVLEKLQHIFPFERLSLFQLYNNELTLTNLYPETSTYNETGTKIPQGNSLYWQAVKDKLAMTYLVEEDDAYRENPTFIKMNIKQVLVFPLFIKNEVIGLFSIGSPLVKNYSEQDIAFLQQLSDHLAVSLENVRLYNEVLQIKNEWEKTFSAVIDLMFLIDLNGNVIRANKATKQFFNKQDKHGFSYMQLLFDQLEEENIVDDCVTLKKSTYRELVFNDIYYYDAYAYPIFNECNEIQRIIMYMKDITQKREYEVQLIQSGKLAAIGELAAGVAHELNNPLTAILGNSQILLRHAESNGDNEQLLTDIYECGRRCKSIIQNLLTFSRQDEYMFEKISINHAIERVLSLIGYQFKQHQIKIRLLLDESILLIEGNEQQLEQVIINLLINAKDALETTEKTNKIITIQTYEHGGNVFLIIEDNGVGIDKSLHHEIFHPFFTTKEMSKGTGLGLSVSLGIIEVHEGEIKLESELNNGSRFIIKLPSAPIKNKLGDIHDKYVNNR